MTDAQLRLLRLVAKYVEIREHNDGHTPSYLTDALLEVEREKGPLLSATVDTRQG